MNFFHAIFKRLQTRVRFWESKVSEDRLLSRKAFLEQQDKEFEMRQKIIDARLESLEARLKVDHNAQ